MKLRNKAKTTSVSSAKTSPTSSAGLHALRPLLVDIDNISLQLGVGLVLDRVSLCIHRGEFVGLIGPNGAGKTTFLRVLLGLLEPTSGSAKPIPAAIGYVPQQSNSYHGLVPMSVLEVVRLGAATPKAAHQALAEVDMQAHTKRRFTELSGGQQQRVIIAKALASQAELLILDEPTTGIDTRSQTEFYQLLHRLQKKNITIIMVSHEVEAVLELVTRVVCLNRSVLYDGPPEHFEPDQYLPAAYQAKHIQLHHHHGEQHA